MSTATLKWNAVTTDVNGNPLVGAVSYNIYRKSGVLMYANMKATQYVFQVPANTHPCFYVRAMVALHSGPPSKTVCL